MKWLELDGDDFCRYINVANVQYITPAAGSMSIDGKIAYEIIFYFVNGAQVSITSADKSQHTYVLDQLRSLIGL